MAYAYGYKSPYVSRGKLEANNRMDGIPFVSGEITETTDSDGMQLLLAQIMDDIDWLQRWARAVERDILKRRAGDGA